MLIEKLQSVSDYEELGKELNEAYLKDITEKSPQYLLKIMSQIIMIFLTKLNIPWEEVETFTKQIEERKMGELFKHFEGWDVQALRRETEEVREELKKELKKEQGEGIRKMVKVIKELSGSRNVAEQKLMEEYELSRENAAEKVALYW